MTENPNPEIRTDAQSETATTPKPESEPTVPATEPTTPAVAEPIDYAQKFAESTRENQILQSRINELEGPRRDLTKEPTDSDLQAAIPGWEYMDEGQKAIARRAYNAERLARDLAADRDEQRERQRWNTDLELAIAKNPSLQGKEQAFKDYANKPSHRGAPMDVLMDAFLHRQTPSTMPTPQPETSAPGLEPGNGGPREAEKPKTLSTDDLKALRESDPKAYRDALLNGPDEISI